MRSEGAVGRTLTLLELYGRTDSYAVAGLAAAIVAATQITGGWLAPRAAKLFGRRTTLLLTGLVASVTALALLGTAPGFAAALALLAVWGLVFAATVPVTQAYINDLIPSSERATVLSSYNLLGSTGGVVVQPILGNVAVPRPPRQPAAPPGTRTPCLRAGSAPHGPWLRVGPRPVHTPRHCDQTGPDRRRPGRSPGSPPARPSSRRSRNASLTRSSSPVDGTGTSRATEGALWISRRVF
ncbi:MAG: MFS transporter [Candidatus Polarisedimenticolia bacterium]